jgi:hypothetical protein
MVYPEVFVVVDSTPDRSKQTNHLSQSNTVKYTTEINAKKQKKIKSGRITRATHF